MDNVQFDNDVSTNKIPRFQREDESFLTRMAMKLGAKNQAQAQMVLLGIAILTLILMVIVIVTQFTSVGKKTVTIPPNMSETIYPPKDI